MNEFKFGDLATVTKLNKRVVVMADQGDSDNVYISEGEGYKTYHMPAHELTLIARPQAWVSLPDEYPEPMVHVNLCVHEKNPSSKYVITALWVPPNSISADDFCWDGYDIPEDENGDCWTPSGWYEKSNDANDYLCCLINQDITATHWMPIPEPPKP